MTYRIFMAIALLIVVSQIGCGGPETASESMQAAKPASPPASHRNSKIPIEVSYPIIKEEEEYNAFSKKRIVVVRLNMKVSHDVLREIALDIKSTENHQYERSFIFVTLSGDASRVTGDP